MIYFFITAFAYLIALFILRYSLPDFPRECPYCKKGIYKRVPKTSNDKLLNMVFLGIIKVKRYECNSCGVQTLRIRGSRKKTMNGNLIT